jgi:ABC-type Fe3+-hydroxamate transport system substrate-binding protein
LIQAAPDVIVVTGDAFAVQKALTAGLKVNPALGNVPAVKTHAIYNLPAHIDASVIEHPDILREWTDALSN